MTLKKLEYNRDGKEMQKIEINIMNLMEIQAERGKLDEESLSVLKKLQNRYRDDKGVLRQVI